MPIVNFPSRDPKLLEEIQSEYQRLRSIESAIESLADMAYEANDAATVANVLRVLSGELTASTDCMQELVSRLER
ncbi:hypothetical protein [Marinobacterium rhizophilum]|uniref:Uncharacterized protein n=1 Tax=Marinobacterium rhizophilum TaxID=420402 RepID=A0ABY5HSP1_9GAMM|nr:hypothetical protein [Marinobacterium rhizophilum]UTW14237.1 hypothetical protein KDW95_11595 [Marinobacterium rhizophilum]